ncbi:MAG TPA: DUF6082 family protein [Trebonia sp.]|nr:DUF6082 family protein [Trebonia sp.]
MFIAVLSTLISSIALVGVAISLLLQARQLRTNQVQATRTAQQELMKFCLENPALAAEVLGMSSPESYVKQVVLNWHVSYLSMGFDVKTVTESSLRFAIREQIFKTKDSLSWWIMARQSYHDWAISRRDKEFVAILEEEFQRASQMAEASNTAATPSSTIVNPLSPSS